MGYTQSKCGSTVCLFAGCLTSQQHASVSQGRICSDNFTCCHTEIEVADQTFYLTQSQYTDTGPTSPSTDPITPGAWQGSHWRAQFLSHWYDSIPKKSRRKRDSYPGPSALEADALTTRPTRWCGSTDRGVCGVITTVYHSTRKKDTEVFNFENVPGTECFPFTCFFPFFSFYCIFSRPTPHPPPPKKKKKKNQTKNNKNKKPTTTTKNPTHTKTNNN